MTAVDLRIDVSERIGTVSGLLLRPTDAWVMYALAHGAGAGMRHRFMDAIARHSRVRGVATLRYQFPFTEAGSRRPDPPGVLEATVRAAADAAREHAEGLPLIAGGKSLGGRMTSSAAGASPADRRVGSGLSRLPAPSAQAAWRAPCRAPAGRRAADVVPAGHARRARPPGPHAAGVRSPRRAGDAPRGRGRRPRVRGAQALGPHRRRGMEELADTVVDWCARSASEVVGREAELEPRRLGPGGPGHEDARRPPDARPRTRAASCWVISTTPPDSGACSTRSTPSASR